MISVIIPTYNSLEFISDSIESVYFQTYKNFELIVVDDGSVDGTCELIKSKFPDVRYFYIDNQGAAHARNFGISVSRGEFIAFLDADDVWFCEKLQKQIAEFSKDDELMLCFTEALFFDDNRVKNGPFKKRDRLIKGDIVKNIFRYSYIGTQTVMVRKKIFNIVGMFEENLCAAEDDNLWMRIALKGKLTLLDEPLVYVREVKGSLSRNFENLIKGVWLNIDLIENEDRYKELKKRIGLVCLQKKKSLLFFAEGYFYFSQKEYEKARKAFIKSFFYFPNIKSSIYFLFSNIPDNSIENLKKIKRNYLMNN